MDGCPTKAPRGGKKTGNNPPARGQLGATRRLLTDAAGVPVGRAIEGANRHDMQLVKPPIERLPVERPLPTAAAPQGMCMEKGYDDEEVRDILQECGCTAHIRARGEEAQAIKQEAGFRARRWVVERTHSGMNRLRRILIRWEKNWDWATRRERLGNWGPPCNASTRQRCARGWWHLRAAGGQHAVRGWGHAYRLHVEHANRARHTCRQGHKTGTPNAESLLLAGWVLVCTTLAPAVLAAQTIMALSRCRWPVAIAIKRWQSVLAVDAWRAKAHSPLAEGWRHGTLLSALRRARRMRRPLGDSWGRLDHERMGTWWRVWGMRKDERAPMSTGALFWKEDAWAACLKVLVERPRRRTLPQLPPAAIDILYRCDASKREGMPIAA